MCFIALLRIKTFSLLGCKSTTIILIVQIFCEDFYKKVRFFEKTPLFFEEIGGDISCLTSGAPDKRTDTTSRRNATRRSFCSTVGRRLQINDHPRRKPLLPKAEGRSAHRTYVRTLRGIYLSYFGPPASGARRKYVRVLRNIHRDILERFFVRAKHVVFSRYFHHFMRA